MGTSADASVRRNIKKKNKNPILSKLSQWEREGRFKKIGLGGPGQIGEGLEKRMAKTMDPVADRWKERIQKNRGKREEALKRVKKLILGK